MLGARSGRGRAVSRSRKPEPTGARDNGFEFCQPFLSSRVGPDLSDAVRSLESVWNSTNGPSVVAPCQHCKAEAVWLQTRNGGWLLFDATERPTGDAFDGNRYAIDRRTRLVVDL